MPNVLGLVSFRIFPTHMGGQKGVALFYKYLQRYLTILLAVSVDNQDSKDTKTVKMLCPNKKIYQNLFTIKKLEKLIYKNKIDIIIAEHSYAGWIAWLVQKRTGKPFIIHSHNIESKRFREMHKWWWKFYYYYEGWIHRKAQYNFFISDEDLNFAIDHFKLSSAKCSVITYGVEEKKLQKNKLLLRKHLHLDENKIILLFNGTLDYKPNYNAVEILMNTIEPLLRQRIENFEIIINGNRAPQKLAAQILNSRNISYTGYVEDVHLYYQAADLFINPICNDTGVKTKLIEAISNNCTAVSTQSGAAGVKKELCGDQLTIVHDYDWNSFVSSIINHLSKNKSSTPAEFFQFYSWDVIAEKASEKISEVEISNG